MNVLTNNWKLKLTALILAVVLWSHVRGEVNPWEEATFQVPLQVNIPATMIALNREKIPATVKVKLRGPRLHLRELKGTAPSNPLALADDAVPLVSNAVLAELDFTLARRGEQNLPIKATSRDEDLEVSSVKPSDIVIVLDKAAQKRVTVRPQLRVAEGYRIDDLKLEMTEIGLSGPANQLEKVERVRARVRSGAFRLNTLRRITVPLEAVDEDGNVVSSVRLDSTAAYATGTLREETVTRRVRVALQLRGNPAPGYRIDDSRVEPGSVRVRGVTRVLKSLERIDVPLSIEGVNSSVRRRVTPNWPTGVVPAGSGRVFVEVDISARRGTPNTSPVPARQPTVLPTNPAPVVTPDPSPSPLARQIEPSY